MSIISEINEFFHKYGDLFDLQTINYTKQVVHNIKTSKTLENFLTENQIGAQLLLNEMTPYCQFKFTQYGDEKLDMVEIQAILNIILFSNELEKMILDDHVSITSLGEIGDLFYTADEYAADYFNQKFDIDMIPGEEFDFTILEEKNGNDGMGFRLN